VADSSSTSSSRAIPRAALLAGILVLAGEAALAALLPVNQGRTQVDDLLARLDTPQPHSPVVVWADSVTAGAILEVGTDPGTADLSSTQAISMAGVFFTYRRFVETAGAPKLLVLSMIPESYGNDLDQVFTPTYFETTFLRWGEILPFAEETGRYGQAVVMGSNKILHPPSMLRRASVRPALQRLRSPRGSEVERLPLLRIAGSDSGLAADLAARAKRAHFEPSSISRRYLELLARDAAATGTRLAVITPALPKSAAIGWSATGYLREFEGFLREFAARHPLVTVDPVLQFADYEDMDMYDTVHLKPVPANAYGRRFLTRVRELAK